MIELLKQIALQRALVNGAKADAREAKQEFEDHELRLTPEGVAYKALGSSDPARKVALKKLFLGNAGWVELRGWVNERQDALAAVITHLRNLEAELEHAYRMLDADATGVLRDQVDARRNRHMALRDVMRDVIRQESLLLGQEMAYDDLQGADEVGAYFDMLDDVHGPA